MVLNLQESGRDCANDFVINTQAVIKIITLIILLVIIIANLLVVNRSIL